jgi:hypothetical protein
MSETIQGGSRTLYRVLIERVSSKIGIPRERRPNESAAKGAGIPIPAGLFTAANPAHLADPHVSLGLAAAAIHAEAALHLVDAFPINSGLGSSSGRNPALSLPMAFEILVFFHPAPPDAGAGPRRLSGKGAPQNCAAALTSQKSGFPSNHAPANQKPS